MISDGQKVNAAVTNAAFLSRTSDSSSVGKIDLLNEDSPAIIDLQATLALASKKSYSLQVVSAGEEVDSETSIGSQFRVVKSASGEQLAASKLFGDKAFSDGIEISLLGTSSTDVLRIENQDEPKGVAINGAIFLRNGTLVIFKYSLELDRWLEVSRNGL